jgi:hypothetical protein
LFGVSGETIELVGGPSAPQVTTTTFGGGYSFTGLQPGTYTIEAINLPLNSVASAGTVHHKEDGIGNVQPGWIAGIRLDAGDVGINYDFVEPYGGFVGG